MHYHLTTTSLDPIELDKQFYTLSLGTIFCRDCKTPLINGPVDIIYTGKIPNIPLNGTGGTATGVVREDLIDSLGRKDVEVGLYLGRLLNFQGRQVDGFFTFNGKLKTIIRGDSSSTYRKCATCGSLIYFPLKKRYLVKEPPLDFPVVESNLGQLIVNEEIYKRFRSKNWLKIGVDKLRLQNQIDGHEEIF